MLVNTPSMIAATMTTIVESNNSLRVGQVAFLSSSTISTKNIRVLRNGFFIGNVAGAEGIEPPTNGFGDRYSTN